MNVVAFTRQEVPDDPQLPSLFRLGDLLDILRSSAAEAHAAYAGNFSRGPVTGLASLDMELGGSLSVGTHVLHAGPGAGKTALALQLAATCGTPALFVSGEMSPVELFRRLIARTSGTYLSRLKTGELDPHTVAERAIAAMESAPRLAIADATRAFARLEWIRGAAEVTRGDERRVLVVIDSLQTWADMMPGDVDEYTRLGTALNGLRTLAVTLESPVLIISERNRAGMRTGGLSAGAGHRRIEYGCESLWELDRKEGTLPDPAGEVKVELTLAKNRNGAAGARIPLFFHGAMQRFREAR